MSEMADWYRPYSARVRADNWGNYSVLRHRRFSGFLVTSKNSGTHWLKYMLAVALAETYGLPHPQYFSENAVRPYIGWPKDTPIFETLPRFAFSHTIPHRAVDWGWIRRVAGLPPYVLLLRHPAEILASHYTKWSYDLKADWLTYLAGDPSGRRYRCDIFWLARFWNRWGDIIKRAGDEICLITYEEARHDPAAILCKIATHWRVDLTVPAISAALAAGTKSAMAAKVDPESEPNVLQNRTERLQDRFQGEALVLYRARIRALFRHDFGYDLMHFSSTD